jgi:signal transduction histidine kinase
MTGDFFALANVFRNLIENACRFRGTEPLCIHVGSMKNGSEWILSVRDNGMGFKPEYAEVIFEPFQRLNGRQYPGSGLGLPVARSIVELHGGKVWTESIPGQGSIFRLSLPAEA